VIINYEYIKNFSLEPDFTDLLNGSVYIAMNGKSSTETILQFELLLHPPLSTYNVEY